MRPGSAARTRPHRGHRRAGQLHRDPGGTGAGAWHRARRRRAGGRRDGRRGAGRCAAASRRAAAMVGDRQPTRPRLPGARWCGHRACAGQPAAGRTGGCGGGRCGGRGRRPAGGARHRRDADRRPAADPAPRRAWSALAACRRRCRRWPPSRSMSIRPRRGCRRAACARRPWREGPRALQPPRRGACAVLAAIHADAFPPREAWGEDAIALQLAMPGVFGLLCTRGGMILAAVAGDEAEVLTLAVVPERRRRGVGAACWPRRWRRRASAAHGRWCWRSRSATPPRARCTNGPGLSRAAAGRAIMPTGRRAGDAESGCSRVRATPTIQRPVPNTRCPTPNAQRRRPTPTPKTRCPTAGAQHPVPNAQCPTPGAQRPVPNAQRRRPTPTPNTRCPTPSAQRPTPPPNADAQHPTPERRRCAGQVPPRRRRSRVTPSAPVSCSTVARCGLVRWRCGARCAPVPRL